jgi:hypothetical protein
LTAARLVLKRSLLVMIMMGLQSLPLPNLITLNKLIESNKTHLMITVRRWRIYNNKIAISSSEAMSKRVYLFMISQLLWCWWCKILSASHGEIKSTEYSATHKIAPLMLEVMIFYLIWIGNFTKRLHIRKINETERLLNFMLVRTQMSTLELADSLLVK